MEFKVGDIIEIVRDDWAFRYRHNGTLGKIIDIRSYHRSKVPTHYIVKFTCFKIPHIYPISDIDYACKLYKYKGRKQ